MDKIRAMLPENDEYISRDPETAGLMTQQEAGFISEILTEVRRKPSIIVEFPDFWAISWIWDFFFIP